MLAKKFLSAPLSSVESERLFSVATNLDDDFRKRMGTEKFEQVLFLNRNLPILNFEY